MLVSAATARKKPSQSTLGMLFEAHGVAARDHRMTGERIVLFGVIEAVMPAAAFAPGERAGSDQHRDRVHVAEFVIGDGAAGRSRRVRPKLIAGQGEAFARANDAAVAPSQIAQRGFGDGGAAGRFEREGLGGGCGSLRHCAACARAEHESFEERVACQAIGSVNSGAGRFAGRVQIWNAGAPVDIGLNAAHGIMSRRVDWRGVLARRWSRPRWVRSSETAPVRAISLTMARETTSRAASSPWG